MQQFEAGLRNFRHDEVEKVETWLFFFFKQKTAYEILIVTGVQTCALPIYRARVDEGVLDVDEDRRRGVHGRQLLHGEHGHEQAAAGAAVRLGDLDPHEAELEEFGNEIGRASCRERV